MAHSQLLTEIADLIGMQNAIILARRFGGRSWPVPKAQTLHETHPLVLAIGLAPAQGMTKAYGGLQLKLPLEVNALMTLRNDCIVRRFVGDGEAGESIRSLSWEFGIDRKLVQRIIDKAGFRDLRIKRAALE